MPWNLFTYIERFLAALPAALKVWQVQTEAGFVTVTEELLEEGIHHLEINAKNFAKLREPGLTAAMIKVFNRHGIHAYQEANSNGHVDLYIVNNLRPSLLVCGEAKVFRGLAVHIDGLAQLLSYATGRCGFSFIISYVRDRPVVAAFDDIRAGLDVDRPERQVAPCQAHQTIQFALISQHTHDSGRNIRVTHAGAYLPIPKKSKKA